MQSPKNIPKTSLRLENQTSLIPIQIGSNKGPLLGVGLSHLKELERRLEMALKPFATLTIELLRHPVVQQRRLKTGASQ
jgi:hypothetical protein